MAERRFLPAQGTAVTLAHYFDMIHDFAARTGTATPIFDSAVEVFRRSIDMGLGEHDVAAVIDAIRALPRAPGTNKQTGETA